MAVAIVGLLGVLIGSTFGLATGYLLLRRQEAARRRFEQWIRLLNAYQDFFHCARTLCVLRESATPEQTWLLTERSLKALHDATLLDPSGNERILRMSAVLDQLSGGSPDLDSLSDELNAIFDDFSDDPQVVRWAAA